MQAILSKAEGPFIQTQRTEFASSGTYVELRQARWHYDIGYEIEWGDLRFGHRGTWGRSSFDEAMKCYAEAVAYERAKDDRAAAEQRPRHPLDYPSWTPSTRAALAAAQAGAVCDRCGNPLYELAPGRWAHAREFPERGRLAAECAQLSG